LGTFDDPVWQAIAAMRIEPDGAALTFTERLARENGWSQRHAAAVMEEYRRFLYLAATGTAPVTPSDQVDQAWHLHLAYTRHYWGELCGHIIGRPLHHGPTAGGGAEGRKYRALYAATLARYREAFGAQPPETIWPPAELRFGVRYQWVDRSRHFLLPKRAVSVAGMAAGATLLAACTVLAAESAAAGTPSALSDFFDFIFGSTFGFIFTMALGLVAIIVIGQTIDHLRGKRTGRQRPSNRKRRDDRDSGGSSDIGTDGWSAGGSGAAAGGAAFIGSGGDFGGSGADGGWDSDSGGSSDSSGGSDSGCSSSGCGGGCGGGD
jgi:hypothetical protein